MNGFSKPLLQGDAVDVSALAYARGAAPAASAALKHRPEDFVVEEDCAIERSGEGEHLWCEIEKRDLSTQDAVQRLSRAAGVHPRDIGYAGLKDRHAVTRQWISLKWPVRSDAPDFAGIEGLTVLRCERHSRKLKRGAHRGNRFTIRLRGLDGDDGDLDADLARVAREGVPNYFGAQRFGRDGRNLALAHKLFAGARLSRNRRGFALSAARSLVFNAVLDARVRDASWNRLIEGEAVMLDGSHSMFALADTAEDAQSLQRRLDTFDIHPSGPLPGRGDADVLAGAAHALEDRVQADYADLIAGLERCGVDAARRALRLPVRDLEWRREADDLVLSFWLPPGAFATTVLREIVTTADPAWAPTEND